MYDVICVGTTTIDLYYKGSSLVEKDGYFTLALGDKYFTDHFYEGVGGGATNVAIGVSKLGLRSTLISEIGQNPFKRVIFEKLDLCGVSYRHALLSHEYYNFSSVLLSKSGERTVINYRTQKTQFLKELPPDGLYEKAHGLYLGNIAQVSEWHRARLLKKARDRGLITFVSLGVEDCQKEYHMIDDILRNTSVLILNTHEFALLVHTHYDRIDWGKPVHNAFPHVALPPVVIVTDGAKGSYGYAGKLVHHEHAERISEIVDSLGAGDAYAAGFISGYIKSPPKHIPSAMKIGSRYASHKLKHLGAN